MKHLILLVLIVFIAELANGQQLLSPSYGFSHKKTSYVTLTNGDQIIGTLKDVDRKKGLIEFVNIEDGEGKKHKLKSEKIKMMYLPPTAIDNMGKALDAIHDVQKWNDQKINEDLVDQGYVYFENAKVKIKKKEMTLLMQLLNPTFSDRVKVYHDPFAKETASIGVAGLTLAGGEDKSYYVQVEGSKAAFRLYKKNYKDEFKGLWSKCPNVTKTYPKAQWGEFTEHVLAYNKCM